MPRTRHEIMTAAEREAGQCSLLQIGHLAQEVADLELRLHQALKAIAILEAEQQEAREFRRQVFQSQEKSWW